MTDEEWNRLMNEGAMAALIRSVKRLDDVETRLEAIGAHPPPRLRQGGAR